MNVSHEKIPGLDRERLHAAIEPVLTAHGVECVELVWRTDRGGWLLEISIEKADTRVPGVGVTTVTLMAWINGVIEVRRWLEELPSKKLVAP